MKAIILAAGYATRLYPLTLDKPKPLLDIGGKPLIDRIISKLEPLADIDEIIIVSNDRFFEHFREWERESSFNKPVRIVNDGTLSNEDRLGPMGEIDFAVNALDIHDDLFVIAGDNLCEADHRKFIEEYHKRGCSVIGAKDIKDVESARLFGVLALDEEGYVKSFVEKPDNPPSTLVSTLTYVLRNEDARLYPEQLAKTGTKESGDFIRYLIENGRKVYGVAFDDLWMDIGSHDQLAEAQRLYSGRQGF